MWSLLALLFSDAEKVRKGKERRVSVRAFRGVIKEQYHTIKLADTEYEKPEVFEIERVCSLHSRERDDRPRFLCFLLYLI